MKKHFILAGMAFAALCALPSCETDDDKAIDKYIDDQYKHSEAITQLFNNVKEVTVSGQVAGFDYVDLGLPSGAQWATCNVGAKSPTGYGDLYAWGETTSKSEYTLENYKHYDSEAGAYTKYTECSEYGVYLDAEDDAATVNWGSEWRMPSYWEQQELLDYCYWRWAANFMGSGIDGMVGISKKNGNVIFLPAGGDSFNKGHERGSYWSGMLGSQVEYAGYVSFNSRYIQTYSHSRVEGRSVRAVVK